MKKELRAEHFEKGQSFNPADFAAWLKASDDLQKAGYTKYLPAVLGGSLIGFLLSNGVGGFEGNILAIACVFGGLILGGVLLAQVGRPVNDLAASLGITPEDVKKARKHLKDGTVAWRPEDTPSA